LPTFSYFPGPIVSPRTRRCARSGGPSCADRRLGSCVPRRPNKTARLTLRINTAVRAAWRVVCSSPLSPPHQFHARYAASATPVIITDSSALGLSLRPRVALSATARRSNSSGGEPAAAAGGSETAGWGRLSRQWLRQVRRRQLTKSPRPPFDAVFDREGRPPVHACGRSAGARRSRRLRCCGGPSWLMPPRTPGRRRRRRGRTVDGGGASA
jgi:hypothetical protein